LACSQSSFLGEVIVAVVEGLSEVEPLTWAIGVAGFVGLAVALSLWWTYFDMVGMRPLIATMNAGINWRLLHLPLVASIAASGAAMVSLIAHGADTSTPAATAWLLGGSVAIAVLAMALLMRQLADYKRFIDVYQPVVRLAAAIAVAALGVAALQPRPIVFVVVLFFMMKIQWTVAVRDFSDGSRERSSSLLRRSEDSKSCSGSRLVPGVGPSLVIGQDQLGGQESPTILCSEERSHLCWLVDDTQQEGEVLCVPLRVRQPNGSLRLTHDRGV
jgi:hypothetical protein